MTKKSRASVIPPKQQLAGKTAEAVHPPDRDTLLMAIEAERQRIFRARAIVQTAAKVLNELYVNDRHEPDIGFVLDAVSDMLEVWLAGLDRVTLTNLWNCGC